MDTARQNNENNRRHTERRCLDGISLAVSQAGVKDLIVLVYSHRRRRLARVSRHSSIARFGSCGRKNRDEYKREEETSPVTKTNGKAFCDGFIKAAR
jgi:hypothetical protein